MRQKSVYPFGLKSPLLVFFNVGGVNYFHPGEFFLRSSLGQIMFNSENRVSWDFEHFLEMKEKNPNSLISFKKLAVFRVYSQSITGSGLHSSMVGDENMRLRTVFGFRHLSFLDYSFGKFLRIYKFMRGLIMTLYFDAFRTKL
jgi:hypothetical protein